MFLTATEAAEWLAHRGFSLLEGIAYPAIPAKYSYAVEIPEAASRRVALAAGISTWLLENEDILLWSTEIDIWNAPPSMPWLFEGYRNSIGATGDLYSQPVFVCEGRCEDELMALIALTMFFSFGALIFVAPRKAILNITHDDFIDFFALDQGLLPKWKELVATFELRGGSAKPGRPLRGPFE